MSEKKISFRHSVALQLADDAEKLGGTNLSSVIRSLRLDSGALKTRATYCRIVRRCNRELESLDGDSAWSVEASFWRSVRIYCTVLAVA